MKTVIYIIIFGAIFIGGILLLVSLVGVPDVGFFSSSQEQETNTLSTGHLFVSTDNGESWNSSVTQTSNTSFILKDIYYYADNGVVEMLAQTNKGVYGSRNNGLSWSVAFGNKLPQKPVSDFSVDFTTSQATIFVASLNASNTPAVFRSQDGGASFRQVYVAPATEQKIVGVKIDQQDTSKVYVLLSNGSLFISYDKGSSWEQYASIATHEDVQFTRLLAYPHNASILFATTKQQLYRSTNAGKTWNPIKVFTNTDIYSININVATQDIYLGTNNAFFHSQNQGTSFQKVDFLLQQGELPLTMVFSDPNSENTLYVGSGNTLYKTTNQGRCGALSMCLKK